MKIGLIDVDGCFDKKRNKKYPNLALMKISSYHKAKGDIVEWAQMGDYDIIYKSKIFTFTPDKNIPLVKAKKVIKGGTGYDIKLKLPSCIENCDYDYSIYPECDFSIQFFSRGCVRNCPFCLVREKEGKLHHCEIKNLNPKGKTIDVFDNNFFANPLWKIAVAYLNNTKQPIILHGVDIRLMDEEKSLALNSMKLKGSSIHIAWDNPKDNILPLVEKMIKHVKRYKITCYILIGFNSTKEEDYYRVTELSKLGIDPFVMIYHDFYNKRIPSQYEKDFASWVNRKWRFKSCDFRNFSPRKGFYCREYYE